MQITKCGICRKTIKDKENSIFLRVRGGGYDLLEFCQKCAEPILKFLEQKKLIGKKTKK